MSNKARFTHIDLLESIAIYFVIIYHSVLYYFDFLANDSAINYFSYFFNTILSTCVPLFFFANGYLLFNRSFNLKKHIHRMVRIIILVGVWAAILMPIYLLIAGEPLSLKTILSNILYMNTDWKMNYSWFMGALICIYILFPALKALFDSNKKAFIFFTVACAILTFGYELVNELLAFAGTVLRHPLGEFNYPFTNMFNPFRGAYGYSFVYFCVGGLIFSYENKILTIPKIKRNCISALGIATSCTMLFLVGVFYSKYVNHEIWDVVWNGYDTIFTFSNVFFIYILSLSYKKEFSLITKISCNTMGIYYIHGLVVSLTRPLVRQIEGFYNIPSALIYAAVILLVCLFVCQVFKKIPFLKELI